jgi:hypothetical protein
VGANDYQYANHYRFVERVVARREMRLGGPYDKRIDDGRNHCALTLDDILPGALYCQCAACKNCFDQEMIDTALANKETCPLCRAAWTDWRIYRNVASS